jgi:hypothetical protein
MSSSPQDTSSIISLSSDLKLEVPNDLRHLTNSPKFDQLVKDKYGAIDVKETLESLVDCGQMLQIALTAADDQPCSLPIIAILSKYQNLVHSCTVTSSNFIAASLLALRDIKDAWDLLHGIENEELVECLPDILQNLANSFETAKGMAEKADKIASEVGAVSDLAEEAIISAKKDQNTNAEANLKIDKQLQEAKAGAKATEHLLKSYGIRLKELSDEKSKAAQAAAQARERQFALDITGAIMGGLGKIADNATSAFIAAKNPFATAASSAATAASTTSHDASTGKSNNTSSNTNLPQIDTLALESEVEKQKQLLTDAESAPDKDSADGKKLIEDRKHELKVATDSLKNVGEALRDVANNQKELSMSLEEKESQLTKLYYQIAETEAKKAAEQQKNLEEMKHMKTNKTQLEQTIFLLHFSYGIMGEVKTTFMNAKTFWELLASECKMISDMKKSTMANGDKVSELASSEKKSALKMYKKKFGEGIARSAMSWAGVGRVSLDAHDAIVDARLVTDAVMKALPTGKATEDSINKLIKQIEPRIAMKVKNHQVNK